MAQIRRDLSTGSISWNLFSFAVPVFLSCFLQALYGNVDAIIVGQCSNLGNITGVTQGSQLMNIVTQLISGLSTGSSVLISQYVGSKQNQSLKKTISTVFTLFTLFAFGLMALMLCANSLFIRILAVNEEAVAPFMSYVTICEIGLFFVFMYNCISAVLQAMGDSRHPLLFVGIACCVNIILDLVLVSGLGMGATGAAVATVIAQLISVVLSVVFLKRNQFPFDFKLRSLRIDGEKARIVFSLSLPYMLQRSLVACSFMTISALANPYGLEAGSAAGIVSKINNFATIPFSAFSTGIATVGAQNIGSGRMDRAKETLKKGFLMCMAYGILMYAFTHFFPEVIIGAFSSNEALMSMAIPFLQYYSLEYILMPVSWSLHGFFTSTGHTLIPCIDGLTASVLCRTPLALFFSRTMKMGLNGIALGSALAVIGSIIPGLVFYFLGTWKKPKIKLSNTEEEDQ